MTPDEKPTEVPVSHFPAGPRLPASESPTRARPAATAFKAPTPKVRLQLCVLTVSGPAPLPLPAGDLTIGRSTTCHFQLRGLMVSRRHAVVSRIGDQLQITDCASENGTFVNGVQVHRTARFEVGDHLRLGDIELIVRPDQTPAPFQRPPVRRLRRALLAAGLLLLCAGAGGAGYAWLLREQPQPASPQPAPAKLSIEESEDELPLEAPRRIDEPPRQHRAPLGRALAQREEPRAEPLEARRVLIDQAFEE